MNYYEILEVSPNASVEVIRMAYKAQVKKYHPDNYKDNPQYAEEKMALFNEAYDVLTDEDKRKAYDVQLKNERNNASVQNEEKLSSTSYDMDIKSANNYTPVRSLGITRKLCNFISNIFRWIVTIIVIFVIAGLITGNLKEWSGTVLSVGKEAVYWGNAAIHNTRNMLSSHKYEEGTAEHLISQYIDAIYDGDAYTVEKCIESSSAELLEISVECANGFRKIQSEEIVSALFEDMSYADYSVEKSSNNRYIYTVLFITYDYQVILQKAFNELQYETDLAVAEKYLKSILYKAPKDLKLSVDIEVIEKDGKWLIKKCDIKELINAMTGNLMSSFSDEGYIY